MSLDKCRECGKEVSTEAKQCPHCGVTKPTKSGPSAVAVVVGFLAFVLILAWVTNVPNSKPQSQPVAQAPTETPEERAAKAAEKAKKEEAFRTTVILLKAIKSRLRDPDSVVWETVLASEDASRMCVAYRARNGFGGMNREIVVYVSNKVYKTAEAWNKHCSYSMYDMAHARQAV